MHICHITTAHPRNDIRVFLKECRSVAAAGHAVTLICADGGGSDEVDGVKIIDVGRPEGRIDRALNATRRVGAAVRELQPDFVHFHDPELIILGVSLSRDGIKVIYDVHENVPATIRTKGWIPYGLRNLAAMSMDVAERIGSRYFYKIVTATPAIAERFPDAKTTVVQNFPFPSELQIASDVPYSGRPPAIAYAGVITHERGLNQMLQAIRTAARRERISLRMAGELADPAMAATIGEYADAVRYEGKLRRSDMATMLSESRAGLVIFQPHQNHINSQPNKLFEYMSAGLPIIASNFPQWCRIVEDGGCGICVDPTDPTAIADAMIEIIRNPDRAEEMGRRGKALVAEKYNWNTQVDALLSVYE